MDFDDSSNKIVTREFLAVVFAGFGNEYGISRLSGAFTIDVFRVDLYHSRAIMGMNHLRKRCFPLQTNL